MLIIETPHCDLPELNYILHLFLNDFLGLPYVVQPASESKILIRYMGKAISLPIPFFSLLVDSDPKTLKLPNLPLATWNADQLGRPIKLTSVEVPVLFGKPNISVNEDFIEVDIDLLGSAFLVLSRFEELLDGERDAHNRFPGAGSFSLRAGLLERPIVDEYVEILWTCFEVVWPGLERRSRSFKIETSCDVDWMYSRGRNNMLYLARNVVRDAIKRGAPGLAAEEIRNFIDGFVKPDNYSRDPLYSRIEWLADVNEAAGTTPVTFYVKADHSNPKFDSQYALTEPAVERALLRIHERGHQIGLHPSYETFRDTERLCREAERLRHAMTRLGISQHAIGGRQHYLRWETPVTARAYEAAGLEHDSTLGFADHAGFRCGTCHEYRLFDVERRCTINVRERPLILMDCTVIDYMGLGQTESALNKMMQLKETCRLFQGSFTVLWHNSYLETQWKRDAYLALLS